MNRRSVIKALGATTVLTPFASFAAPLVVRKRPFCLIDRTNSGDNASHVRKWFAFHEDTASGIYTGMRTDRLTVTREVHGDTVTDHISNLKIDISNEVPARFGYGIYFVSVPNWFNDSLLSYERGLAEVLRMCRESTKESRANGERAFRMTVDNECGGDRVVCTLWAYAHDVLGPMRCLPSELTLIKIDSTDTN